MRRQNNVITLTKEAPLRESLRKKVLGLRWGSENDPGVVWLCENRLATVALALRACVATGISLSASSAK